MPLEFWIVRHGNEIKPSTPVDVEHIQELPEGQALKVSTNAHRSLRHHRLFMAAIAQAWVNWPESHEFKPQSFDHLRAWLLCKARYCNITTHELDSPHIAEVMVDVINQSLTQSSGYGFAVYSNNLVYVLTPKSIKWSKLPQKEFNKISQKVSDVLKAEIEMSLDDFKAEVGKAA